jgi:RNA polymerase sigma-70 factor, ECF subfamily
MDAIVRPRSAGCFWAAVSVRYDAARGPCTFTVGSSEGTFAWDLFVVECVVFVARLENDAVDGSAPVGAGVGVAVASGPSDGRPSVVGSHSFGWRHALTAWRSVGEAGLVRAAQRGSEEAVAELFRRHWDGLHRAALLITGDAAAAEDIAQEAFLAALRGLGRFDVRRPLRPWMHRIAVNRAIDFSRARKLRREVADLAPDRPAAESEGSAMLDDELAAGLLRLEVEQRAVVVLRYVLELTPGEIATVLELPRGTVNSRMRRGLDALGELLGGEPE